MRRRHLAPLLAAAVLPLSGCTPPQSRAIYTPGSSSAERVTGPGEIIVTEITPAPRIYVPVEAVAVPTDGGEQ